MLKSELQTLVNELTSQVALYQEVNAAQASKLAQVTKDLKTMTARKEAAQAERNNRDQEASDLYDQVQTLKAQKAEAEDLAHRLKAELAEEKADNKQVAASWFEAFEQNQALKAEVDKWKANYLDVCADRWALSNARFEALGQLEAAQNDLAALRMEVRGLTYVKEGLAEDLAQAQELAALRAMDIARLTQQVNEYTEDKHVLYECFKETQADLDEAREDARAAREQLIAARQDAMAARDEAWEARQNENDQAQAFLALSDSHRGLQLQVFDLQTVVNLQKAIMARLAADLGQAQPRGQ